MFTSNHSIAYFSSLYYYCYQYHYYCYAAMAHEVRRAFAAFELRCNRDMPLNYFGESLKPTHGKERALPFASHPMAVLHRYVWSQQLHCRLDLRYKYGIRCRTSFS
jgi:hypothetical protein